jgi:hemerythrin-like domain-containing protein
MPHDDFVGERYRLERVLEILESLASRLESRAHVPHALVRDTVAFIKATEAAEYGAVEESLVDPLLSACIRLHLDARHPLEAMERALPGVEGLDAAATAEFVRAARRYVQMRRDHLRADDQLFSSRFRSSSSPPAQITRDEAERLRRYERLVEEAAALDTRVTTTTGRTRHA